jgi:hypothetical protein
LVGERIGLQIDPSGHFAIMRDSWARTKGSGFIRPGIGDLAACEQAETRGSEPKPRVKNAPVGLYIGRRLERHLPLFHLEYRSDPLKHLGDIPFGISRHSRKGSVRYSIWHVVASKDDACDIWTCF